MSLYEEKLQALLTAKSASKANGKEYCANWLGLVREEGYTALAERFLFAGSKYAVEDVFCEFIVQSTDPLASYNAFAAGNVYRKEKEKAFKLELLLLAAALTTQPVNKALLGAIMRKLPLTGRKSNGELYRRIFTTYEKVCQNLVKAGVTMPSLTELEITSAEGKLFTDFILELNALYPQKELTPKDIKQRSVLLSENARESEGDLANSQNALGSDEATNKILKRIEDLAAKLMEHSSRVSSELKRLAKEEDEFKQECWCELKALKQAVSSITQSAEQKAKAATTQLQQAEVATSQVEVKSSKEESDNGASVDVEALLREKADLAQCLEVMEINAKRQLEEKLERIAAALRAEYSDYKDAVDMPMSVALGENLRAQLKAVFAILARCGISVR